MLFMWSGLGYLGFMIPFAFWAFAIRVWGLDNLSAMRIASLFAAITVYFVGKWVNRDDRDKLDIKIGIPLRIRHTTYGFPLQRAAVISLIGFAFTFNSTTSHVSTVENTAAISSESNH